MEVEESALLPKKPKAKGSDDGSDDDDERVGALGSLGGGTGRPRRVSLFRLDTTRDKIQAAGWVVGAVLLSLVTSGTVDGLVPNPGAPLLLNVLNVRRVSD